MTGFTSGKISHDPEPWVSRRTGERYPEPDAAPETVLTWGMDLAPRPEFEHHNPILVDFRRLMGEIIQTGSGTESPAQAEWWIELLDGDPHMDNPYSWGDLAGSDQEQIDHARRVLTRLADLTRTETS